jgi:branched-chain amino acid transport system ATP-binding protein
VTASAEPLLDIQNLTAGYGPLPVLHDMSFRIHSGETVVLLGANGAGKTTTLRAISGSVWRKGRVMLRGFDQTRAMPHAIAAAGVAHVPQGRGTFADFTVQENLELGAYTRRDKAGIARDIRRWYELFPRLGERSRQVAGSLSGGEQQMLAIARALMLKPVLLLLDEPSLGLAPVVTQELFSHLRTLREELSLTILVVEQNATLALAFADHCHVLENGRMVLSGSAAQMRSNTSIQRAYLGY